MRIDANKFAAGLRLIADAITDDLDTRPEEAPSNVVPMQPAETQAPQTQAPAVAGMYGGPATVPAPASDPEMLRQNVRVLCQQIMERRGTNEPHLIPDVLARVGAANISAILPEHLPMVVRELEALLNA